MRLRTHQSGLLFKVLYIKYSLERGVNVGDIRCSLWWNDRLEANEEYSLKGVYPLLSQAAEAMVIYHCKRLYGTSPLKSVFLCPTIIGE